MTGEGGMVAVSRRRPVMGAAGQATRLAQCHQGKRCYPVHTGADCLAATRQGVSEAIAGTAQDHADHVSLAVDAVAGEPAGQVVEQGRVEQVVGPPPALRLDPSDHEDALHA